MTEDMKVPEIARSLVAFLERRPFVGLAVSVLLVATMAMGMGKLHADFTHRGFFFADDPMLVAFDEFERRFGNDDAIVVAMHSESGIFDKDSAELLMTMTERMWQVPEVMRVDSLSNFNWVHAEGDDIIVEPLFPDDQEITHDILAHRKKVALQHETIPGYLVSEDAKTAMIFGAIKPGIERPSDAPAIVTAVRELFAELKSGDHEFYASGGPAITFAFQESSQLDMQTLVPMVLGASALFLLVLLRSLAGLLLPFGVVGLSIVSSLGFAGWTGITLTNITSSLPNILIAIGIADAVHILVSYYRAQMRGLETREAARYALIKNFKPTLLTSLTTAIGFFSFVSADLKPLAGLGWMAGFGALVAWIFTYFFLGALLFVLPMRKSRVKEAAVKQGDRRVSGFVNVLGRRRNGIIATTAILVGVCTGLATRAEVNSDPFKYFQEGFPARVANEFIEAEVGGARGIEIVIDTGEEEGIKDPAFLRKVDAYQKWIETIDGVTRSVSIIDILKQTHRSLHGDDPKFYALADNKETIGQELFLYTMSLPQGMDLNDRVSIKNDALRVTILWTIPTSSETVVAIDNIEAKGAAMGLNVNVTGKNRLYQSMNGYVVDSFLVSVTTALVLISILLIVFFKSWKLGLLAMIPNMIPLIGGAAALVLIGQPLDIGTVLVASVCLGIAVDDTIHILTNYARLREEGKDRVTAVREVMMHTAPALLVTTAILVAGFGMFMFATFMPNLYFGLLTAIILSIALFVDVTFLPALLMGSGSKSEPDAGTSGQKTLSAA